MTFNNGVKLTEGFEVVVHFTFNYTINSYAMSFIFYTYYYNVYIFTVAVLLCPKIEGKILRLEGLQLFCF